MAATTTLRRWARRYRQSILTTAAAALFCFLAARADDRVGWFGAGFFVCLAGCAWVVDRDHQRALAREAARREAERDAYEARIARLALKQPSWWH